MKDLDKITKLQISEAIENIKICDNLEQGLIRDENNLEKAIRNQQAGTVEWKEMIESISLYSPDYERLLKNKTSGHRSFSILHGCG